MLKTFCPNKVEGHDDVESEGGDEGVTEDPWEGSVDMPKEEDATTMDDATSGDATMDGMSVEENGSADWAELTTGVCNRIAMTYGELSSWNNADETGKKEIEDRYFGELEDFIVDWFDGAVSSVAVAGTALATSFALLAF